MVGPRRSPPADEAAPRPRLVDLAAEWLSLVAALRRSAGGDAAVLRTRVLELRDAFTQAARDLGVASVDIESATFALVGFLDETVLATRGPLRDAWVGRPLQLELFGIRTAGQDFFERLDRMRRERDARIEALEVSYACLMLGFAGMYRLHSPEKLAAVTADLERDIVAARGAPPAELSPHGTRREQSPVQVASKIPSWAYVASFVVLVALAWLIVFLVAGQDADRAVRELSGLAG